MLKLMKLMRILRLSRKMENIDIAGFMNPAVVRLIKLLGKIVFAAHFLGCMWFMVNDCDVDSEDDDLWQSCGGDGLGSKVCTFEMRFLPGSTVDLPPYRTWLDISRLDRQQFRLP